ncbi:AAA family ATPase [Falsiroseomonas sp. HC035]|uniref:AAA family ATPase n=1 Tax=Falsiroseomonas sp. HC035 TaxID=3390999 RepID=UPI003D31A76E
MDYGADPDTVFRNAGAHEEHFAPPPPRRGKPYGRLRLLTIADAEAAPPRRYLLKGLIAPGELSLWWGPPKCGKSFLKLRLAYGLALGVGMWGRKAKPCRVLYVAAEGEGGFAARLLALRDAMGNAGDAFQYVAQSTVIGPPAGDLSAVIAAAIDMRADIIVFDTVARTFGDGDENTAQDMGGYVASVDRVRAETGAHVAVIHHGTKQGDTSRGSGAMVGAADLIVKVSKGVDGEPSVAKVEAAKDDTDGAELPFRLRVVDLGLDDDDDPRTTCVAEEVDGRIQRRKPLTESTKQALAALANIILTEGKPLPVGPLMPLNAMGVEEGQWRAECEARRLSLAEKEKDRDRVFRRAAKDLRDAGEVAMREGWVWLLRPGQAQVNA